MKLKPTDTEVVPLRTQLLQELGRTDEAIRELESRLKTEPSNYMLRLQYASLLAGIGREEESLREYKNVLTADSSNETALYNLAAHYKNVAGNKQRAELEKMDADVNYKPNMSYMDDLAVAAVHFEKLRVSPKYASDIIVLEQLANIYEVRKETAKVKALIMELEALEGLNLSNKEYYRIMEGLYGRNKMMDKMKQAAEKGAKL
jgi:tetratricopeptide (TPR) repeat protein